MKPFLCSLLLLFTLPLNAQSPTAVPIPKEPHHHLVLENAYVRVFRVSVPAHDATLLHQHDVPYLFISLGPADVVNAVQGRPEARIVMADGQVGYSPGDFAHIARTDAGSTFDNVTIELLHPQGEPRNLCASVVAGPTGACPNADFTSATWYGAALPGGSALFETDEILLQSGVVAPNSSYDDKKPAHSALLIAMDGSHIKAKPSGAVSSAQRASAENLRGGEVYWLPAGAKRSIQARAGVPARFFLLTFRDSGPASQLTGQPSSQRRVRASTN